MGTDTNFFNADELPNMRLDFLDFTNGTTMLDLECEAVIRCLHRIIMVLPPQPGTSRYPEQFLECIGLLDDVVFLTVLNNLLNYWHNNTEPILSQK